MHTPSIAAAESFLLTYALNALWQIPLLFAAAWLAARASRRAGPAFQHASGPPPSSCNSFCPPVASRCAALLTPSPRSYPGTPYPTGPQA